MGRFLQEDPVGYLLGPNLYTYVNNNPINWIDPWGLWGEKDHINAGDKDFRRKWDVDYSRQDRGGTNPVIQPWRHFRERESVERGLQKDIERGDIKNFQGHMHQGQDTFSHYDQGYRWWEVGHVEDSIWNKIAPWGNPAPDDPSAYPDAYKEMEEWTKEWERKWEEKCGKDKCK